MAGTGACLIRSIFMAMVPPVAKNSTTGLGSSASADAAIRQAKPDNPAASMLRIDRPPHVLLASTQADQTVSSFAILRQQTSVRRGLGLFSAKRRCCSADKAGRAIAQRDIGDPCQNDPRHKNAVVERSLPVPRVFGFHRAVAKTNQTGQGEERHEPDQAAQLENEKGDHDAEGYDNQTRI